MSIIKKSNNKYICTNKEKLKEFMKKEGFIFKNSILQKDEYFVDLQGEMVKNDSCVRLRTIKDKNIIKLTQYAEKMGIKDKVINFISMIYE